MNLILLLIIISLIFLFSYIPGRIIASILPFSYPVIFSVSFGLTYFIFFLAGFGAYIFRIPYEIEWIILVLFLLGFALLINRRRPIKVHHNELKLFSIFFLVFVFLIAVQGLTPYYSGAGSYWDWF